MLKLTKTEAQPHELIKWKKITEINFIDTQALRLFRDSGYKVTVGTGDMEGKGWLRNYGNDQLKDM